MIDAKTDEELLASVIDITKDDAPLLPLPGEVVSQKLDESRMIQTELLTRTSLLERHHQEAMMRWSSKDALLDERMGGLLRRMTELTTKVEDCISQVKTFRSVTGLVTIGTGVVTSAAIRLLQYFFS